MNVKNGCALMIDPMRDLAKVTGLGQISSNGFVEATYGLRIDFHLPTPLSQRPANLDSFLVRAAKVMGNTLAYYEAEGEDFASSRGRKARSSDIAQLANISEMMLTCEQRHRIEIAERRAHIEAHTGLQTLDVNFPDQDYGVLILSESGATAENANMIALFGFGYWRVSLSFGPDIAQKHWDEIQQLALDIMLSGISAGATFGYALNLNPRMSPDQEAKYFTPSTQRFQMLHPIGPAQFGFFPPNDCGVLPPACWYAIEDSWAVENGLDPAVFRTLNDSVHNIIETENGVLVQLWHAPILGDLNDEVDLSPAYALGRVLKPAIENAWQLENYSTRKVQHGLRGISVGEKEDKWRFYTRFCQEASKS